MVEFEYFLRVKMPRAGRVRIIKRPFPLMVGLDVGIERAIEILKEEKEKFNRAIDEYIEFLEDMYRDFGEYV